MLLINQGDNVLHTVRDIQVDSEHGFLLTGMNNIQKNKVIMQQSIFIFIIHLSIS